MLDFHHLHPPGEPRHDVGHGAARDELEAGESVARQAVGQVVAHPVDLREVNQSGASLPEKPQCLSRGKTATNRCGSRVAHLASAAEARGAAFSTESTLCVAMTTKVSAPDLVSMW